MLVMHVANTLAAMSQEIIVNTVILIPTATVLLLPATSATIESVNTAPAMITVTAKYVICIIATSVVETASVILDILGAIMRSIVTELEVVACQNVLSEAIIIITEAVYNVLTIIQNTIRITIIVNLRALLAMELPCPVPLRQTLVLPHLTSIHLSRQVTLDQQEVLQSKFNILQFTQLVQLAVIQAKIEEYTLMAAMSRWLGSKDYIWHLISQCILG